VTASRPASLARLGLGWEPLHERLPRLCHVAIVGFPSPRDNEPGHDLTYQAELGLVDAPRMPRVLVADMAGALEAVNAALALLLARERGQGVGHKAVALSEAAEHFGRTYAQGITSPGGMLGGGIPSYGIYRTKSGYLAVAALEAHFLERLQDGLGLSQATREDLEEAFLTRTAKEWEDWARTHDLPLAEIVGD
jgi:alpha-methylacyl-CoA racemase